MNNQHLILRSGAHCRIAIDGLPPDSRAAASVRDASRITTAAALQSGALVLPALMAGGYELEIIVIADTGSIITLHRGILEVFDAIALPAAAAGVEQMVSMVYSRPLKSIQLTYSE